MAPSDPFLVHPFSSSTISAMEIIMSLKNVFAAISMLIFLGGATPAIETSNNCSMRFTGEIDKRLLNGLRILVGKHCHERTVVISSNGGAASISIEIAEIIRDNEVNLVVENYCISSCVEFLMPAAKKINFQSFPVIGVHGNPMLIEFLAKHYKPPGVENCTFLSSRKEFEIKSRASNPAFWETQLKVLGVETFYVGDPDPISNCPNFYVDFKSDLWILSSKDLNDHLNIITDDEICGDRPDFCKKKMEEGLGMSGKFVFSADSS